MATIKPNRLAKNKSKFIERIRKSDKPAILFRFNRYKLYSTVAKHYPKASKFYSEVFRRLDKKDGVKFFLWLPEFFYVGPFTLRFRFKRTEKIISDLEKRNIPIDKIINNERVSMSIAQYGIFNYGTTKSKAYEAYLSKLENIIKN